MLLALKGKCNIIVIVLKGEVMNYFNKPILKILIINILVITAYLLPYGLYLGHIELVRLRFNRQDLKHERIIIPAYGTHSIEINGQAVRCENIISDKGYNWIKQYMLVNGERLNREGSLIKMYDSKSYLINLDKDPYLELYLYRYEGDYDLLDFYEEDGEIRYRLTKLPKNHYVSKNFELYIFGMFENSEGLMYLFLGLFLTTIHLTVALLIVIVKLSKRIIMRLFKKKLP